MKRIKVRAECGTRLLRMVIREMHILPHNELQSQSDDQLEFIQLSTDSQHSQLQQRQILFQRQAESENKKELVADVVFVDKSRSTGAGLSLRISHRFPHQLALIFIRKAFAQR